MSAINPAQELFAVIFVVYFALTIERANITYKPFDTYRAWKGSLHVIRRLLVAWIVLVFFR